MDSKAGEMMTTREVAEYLRLNAATVYKLARAGQIPGAKVGRVWRFKKQIIDKWFQQEMADRLTGSSAR